MKHKIVLVRNVLSGLYEINKGMHLIFKLNVTWSNYIRLTLFYFYMMQVRKKM